MQSKTWLIWLALGLGLLSAAPASSEEQASQPFRRLLALVPAIIDGEPLEGEGGAIGFVDVASMARDRAVIADLLRQGHNLTERFLFNLLSDREEPGSFLARSGLEPDRVREVLWLWSLRRRMGRSMLVTLSDAAPARLALSWGQAGYRTDVFEGREIWTRGMPGTLDILHGDARDPFRTGLGMSAVLALDGNRLLLGTEGQDVAIFRRVSDLSVAARPDVAALLDALDHALAPEEHIAQARLDLVDNKDPFTPSAALTVELRRDGVPVFGIAVAAYPDCVAAERMAKRLILEARVSDAGRSEWHTYETGGRCALIVRMPNTRLDPLALQHM